MTYLNTFERYEIKYILTDEQRSRLEHLMSGRMKIDRYGHSTIRNIYYDTDDYRLIRHSLDRPVYKEKLRVRSYGRISEEDDVFVELKKKYDSVVYKRRIALPEHTATEWLSGDGQLRVRSQIGDEIEYVRRFYPGIKPKVYISYEREAYYPVNGEDLRITLDSNIIARDYDLSLLCGVYGTPVTGRDLTILEVKVPGAVPMWLIRFLDKNGIRKTSISKYGSYYRNMRQAGSADNERGELYA